MGLVAPGSGVVRLDLDEARQAAQELKRLGGQLMPAGPGVPEGTGPEQSVAAVAAVSTSGDHVARECGTILQEAGVYLESAVRAFGDTDQRNAATISSVDARNM